VLLATGLLLCGCGSVEKEAEQIPSLSKSKKDVKLDPASAELKRLYEAAQSPYERRAVAFRAIDEGSIQRGGPVSSIDAIFGTNFSTDLPLGKDSKQIGMVDFGPTFSQSPAADGKIVAGGHIGWSMMIEYDHDGQILNYNLTNIWKGHSSYEKSKECTPVAELRQLYEIALSDDERRAVCLRAIDEGVITTFRKVAGIDEIFGTHLAPELPTKNEGRRIVRVDFNPPDAVAAQDKGSAGSKGWYFSVDYDDQGEIRNYFLSNLRE
jgi:hypothetical protein